MKDLANSHHQDIDQPSEKSNGLATQEYLIRWISIIFAGALVITAIFYIILAWQLRIPPLIVVAVGEIILATVAVAGVWLLHHGRLGAGVSLVTGSILGAILLASGLFANLGLILSVATILVGPVIASQLLPKRQAVKAISASVIVGLMAGLLAWFSPFEQIDLPVIQTLVPIIIGLTVVSLAFFAIQALKTSSLSTKFVLTFLVIALTPLGFSIFVNSRMIQASLTEKANWALLTAARQTADTIDNFISANLDAVRAQSELPAFIEYLSLPAEQRQGSPQETQALTILNALQSNRAAVSSSVSSYGSYITSYALLDAQGRDVADTAITEIGTDKSDRDYFKIPFETGRPYVSPVQFSPTIRAASLYFSNPIFDKGNIVGILRVRYSATILQQLIAKTINSGGPESFAALFDEHHIHLAHATNPLVMFKPVVPLDPALSAELKAARRLPAQSTAASALNLPDLDQGLTQAATQPNFAAADVGSGDRVYQAAVATLETQPWLVAFFQPQEVFLSPIQTQVQTAVLFAGVIAGLVVIAAFGFSRFLVRPVVNLTAVARQVAEGNLNVEIPVENQDEIGQLAETFNIMTTQLRTILGSLAEQVQNRTAELTLSMEVGQRAAAIRSVDELLPTITEFIRDRFDLYYTHVYFVDDVGENLVIQAGTGEVGQQLLARRHSLPVGPGSIVGRVAAEGRSIVVPDTAASDIHKPNPLLPETRSELAVPLLVEGRVLGVLDMQSNRTNTFTEQNVTVFEAMATQLAIAIDSAQQWTRSQEAQRRSEEAVRQLTREVWAERLSRQQGEVGFVYDLAAITPLERAGETIAANNGYAVPLVVQNQPIGRLSVAAPADQRWSDEEEDLLAAVAQQLAQKAENLRLLEQTRERASREQLARQIADRIRASRDIETALKTAVEELSRALGASRAVVDLRVSGVDETSGQESVISDQ